MTLCPTTSGGARASLGADSLLFCFTRGAALLAEWFPGVVDELYDGGAIEVDVCRDLYWHQCGGPAARSASALYGPGDVAALP